jgi:hypothetical protein
MNNAVHGAAAGDQKALEELWHRWVPMITPCFQVPATTDAELMGQASIAVAWLINEGLEGVEEGIDAEVLLESDPYGSLGRPGSFLFAPRPKDLLGYARAVS